MKHGPNEIDAIVGLRIRTRREEIGLSQMKLGEALGVSFQQIQKYETGLNRVSVGRVAALSKALKVPPTFFFTVAEDRQDFEVEIVRHNDRYARRLLSAFNRIADDTKRKKIVEALEAIIQAVEPSEIGARLTPTDGLVDGVNR